jgi:hypothetical protein
MRIGGDRSVEGHVRRLSPLANSGAAYYGVCITGGPARIAVTAAVALAGMLVVAPTAAAQFEFPPTPFGSSAPDADVVLVNEGPDQLSLGEPAVSGMDMAAFPIRGGDCAGALLSSGDSCAVSVGFVPARVGAHTATLDVRIMGDPVPLSTQLLGEGVPWVRITPQALDFGTLAFGTTSQPLEVLVENIADRPVRRLATSVVPLLPRGFRADSTSCRATPLAPGASCRIPVTFRAASPGVSEARLRILNSTTEIGSAPLRATTTARPTVPGRNVPPDATAHLRQRLRASLVKLRGRARTALLRRGLTVRGIVPPAQGVLRLDVWTRAASPRRPGASQAARLVAIRRRLPVQASQRVAIRARTTRRGKRLLRSGRRLILDVTLSLTAHDGRYSEATGVLRLPRVRQSRSR